MEIFLAKLITTNNLKKGWSFKPIIVEKHAFMYLKSHNNQQLKM